MDIIKKIARILIDIAMIICVMFVNAIVIQFILNNFMRLGVDLKFAIGVVFILLIVKGNYD